MSSRHAHPRIQGPSADTAHLSDEALLDLHVRRRAEAGSGEPVTDAHADACAHCSAALAELDADLAALTLAATTAMDAVISPDRLARQREIIDRRLEGQPGRVLRFPVSSRTPRTPHRLHRWVAMAAACGLLFGLAAGRMVGPAAVPDLDRGVAWSAAEGQRAPGAPSIEPAVADEFLLSEVDAALARTLHHDFRVLDELTPRAPEAPGPR